MTTNKEVKDFYISKLHQEVTKRGLSNEPTVTRIKDENELNNRIIKSYENKLPKTVVNKIKKGVFN